MSKSVNLLYILYNIFVTPFTTFCLWATYWTIPPLVDPNLAWRTLSWCRRTSVRPPDDMEKSVAHKLQCAMPQSGNFAIQAKFLFQSSLNLHCLFGASRIFTGGSAIAYPENVENSARNHPENASDYPIFIRSSALYCVARQKCSMIGNEKKNNKIF